MRILVYSFVHYYDFTCLVMLNIDAHASTTNANIMVKPAVFSYDGFLPLTILSTSLGYFLIYSKLTKHHGRMSV